MIIEIDQSGKVEQTGRDTVLALASNTGFTRSIKISAKEKRKLQKFFREVGKPHVYVYKVFSALVVLLIKPHIVLFDRIVIDTEYMHQDAILRNQICEFMQKDVPEFDASRIVFHQIGKKSQAHHTAYKTYKRIIKPNQQVTARDVLRVIIQ